MAEHVRYMPRLEELGYTFGGLPPVVRLRPGDLVTVDTQDCFGGLVESFEDLPSRVVDLGEVNPVSGPSGGVELGSAVSTVAFSLVSAPVWQGRVCATGVAHGSWCRG